MFLFKTTSLLRGRGREEASKVLAYATLNAITRPTGCGAMPTSVALRNTGGRETGELEEKEEEKGRAGGRGEG